MSETLAPAVETPAVQATPVAAIPAGAAHEAAAGTQPPETGAPAAESPAAPSLPETPEVAPSLLSAATQPAEPPPAEAEASPPVEPPSAEPLPLPTYEAFSLPDGVSLDQERQSAFTTILGETEQKIVTSPAEAHTLVQEMGQKLINLYLEEGKRNAEQLAKEQWNNWTKTREDWVSEFKEDPEIGGNRRDTTIARCAAMVEMYGKSVGPQHEQALRDAMTVTGAGDHPALIRFINWAAGFAVENSRMVAAPAVQQSIPMSRAQRMYRNSIPTNGAG